VTKQENFPQLIKVVQPLKVSWETTKNSSPPFKTSM